MSKFNLDKESIMTVDTFRVIYFAVFAISFLITEFGRFVYRPYVYSNGLNDFGLADAIGNLGGIVVQIFFILAIINPPKRQGFIFIALLPLGYVLYEILQPYLPKGVFDWKDVWGTLLGGVIALVVYLIIHWVVKNKVIFRLKINLN